MKADPPEIKIAKKQYAGQRQMAEKRGIGWEITFQEWYDFWLTSGKYPERGRGRGKYAMCRYNDKGPYKLGNIFVQTHEQNTIDAHYGKPSRTKGKCFLSEDQKQQVRQRMMGNRHNDNMPRMTCAFCGITAVKANIHRWHNNRCKLAK